MDIQDLLMTALRASIVYLFLLVVVRLLGKRSVGNYTAFDLLVALMLGEVVDEAIFGDVSLLKGLLAIAVVAAWHLANAFASYRSTQIDRLTAGTPRVLIEDGKVVDDALAAERMNPEELYSQLRMLQIDRDEIKDIERATLETNGHVSVIKKPAARPLEKGELQKARRQSEA